LGLATEMDGDGSGISSDDSNDLSGVYHTNGNVSNLVDLSYSDSDRDSESDRSRLSEVRARVGLGLGLD
jgi:hypothetical protein